jgi:hypothetical protein
VKATAPAPVTEEAAPRLVTPPKDSAAGPATESEPLSLPPPDSAKVPLETVTVAVLLNRA